MTLDLTRCCGNCGDYSESARAAEEQAHREFVLSNLETYYRDARVSAMSCAEAANEPARFRSER